MTDSSQSIGAALARIATNVAVVTAAADGPPHGVTANVWAEGADPPLVLITLRNDGSTLSRVITRGHFAANVLGSDQVDLAVRFARAEPHPGARFEDVKHRIIGKAPVLDRCHAWFSCAVDGTAPFGSYTIVVGAVLEAGPGTLAAPLLFHGGGFHPLGGAEDER